MQQLNHPVADRKTLAVIGYVYGKLSLCSGAKDHFGSGFWKYPDGHSQNLHGNGFQTHILAWPYPPLEERHMYPLP